MKRLTYRQAPAHIRRAIREAATRWETTDGTPLIELLDEAEETVDNATLDALMCSQGGTLRLHLPDPVTASRVRGRAHYSARIHNATLATRYESGVLTLTATR